MSKRNSLLAGSWYPSSREVLLREIESLFLGELGPKKLPTLGSFNDNLVALISPHAGYVYSGQAAAWSYYELAKHGPRDLAIIIGPNHSGIGSGISASSHKKWETPLGSLEVDLDFSRELAKIFESLDFDNTAHAREHSIEIQLPFLQYIYGSSFKIVPISIWLYDLNLSIKLGESIAKIIKDYSRKAIIIASSDMTHYVPQEVAEERDRITLDAILSLDEFKTWKVASELESLCGLAPVVSVMRAAKIIGAKRAEVLKYYTSGDVSGEKDAVVGYSSVAFKKN
ncbi:MAG: AmmeMemoRadiSam system protein B [Thermoproteota archaeon]|nr:AmmeMemoRadiSam system protein B [Candidatus Brockarchaeota archaeon]